MMANHRTLALTPFDPTRAHRAQCIHTLYTVHYEGQSPTCTAAHDVYIAHGEPVTNETTSFVFEFGILALMSSALNVGKYRSIKARRRMVTLYSSTCTVYMYTCTLISPNASSVHSLLFLESLCNLSLLTVRTLTVLPAQVRCSSRLYFRTPPFQHVHAAHRSSDSRSWHDLLFLCG